MHVVVHLSVHPKCTLLPLLQIVGGVSPLNSLVFVCRSSALTPLVLVDHLESSLKPLILLSLDSLLLGWRLEHGNGPDQVALLFEARQLQALGLSVVLAWVEKRYPLRQELFPLLVVLHRLVPEGLRYLKCVVQLRGLYWGGLLCL